MQWRVSDQPCRGRLAHQLQAATQHARRSAQQRNRQPAACPAPRGASTRSLSSRRGHSSKQAQPVIQPWAQQQKKPLTSPPGPCSTPSCPRGCGCAPGSGIGRQAKADWQARGSSQVTCDGRRVHAASWWQLPSTPPRARAAAPTGASRIHSNLSSAPSAPRLEGNGAVARAGCPWSSTLPEPQHANTPARQQGNTWQRRPPGRQWRSRTRRRQCPWPRGCWRRRHRSPGPPQGWWGCPPCRLHRGGGVTGGLGAVGGGQGGPGSPPGRRAVGTSHQPSV